MRFATVGVMLLLVSLLSGEEPNKASFSDCDKNATTQADLTECAGNDLKKGRR